MTMIAGLCLIKQNTIRTYSSKMKAMLEFINALDDDDLRSLECQSTTGEVITSGDPLMLAAALAHTMSEEGFEMFMAWRAEHGLVGIPSFRCALLKAQEVTSSIQWAKSDRMIRLAKGFELRAVEIHPDTTPVGAITEEMMTHLCETVVYEEKESLVRFIKAQFYGCFRVSEMLDLSVDSVTDTHVSMKDTKAKRASSGVGTKYKQVDKLLSQWPSGQKALEILREQQQHAATKTGKLFKFGKKFTNEVYNDIIKECGEELGWDYEELKYCSHGLRHGGIGMFKAETNADFPEETLRAMLDMSKGMVEYYAESNTKRLADKLAKKDKFDSELIQMRVSSGDQIIQVDPVRVSLQEVYTGIPSGPRTLPEYLGGPPRGRPELGMVSTRRLTKAHGTDLKARAKAAVRAPPSALYTLWSPLDGAGQSQTNKWEKRVREIESHHFEKHYPKFNKRRID